MAPSDSSTTRKCAGRDLYLTPIYLLFLIAKTVPLVITKQRTTQSEMATQSEGSPGTGFGLQRPREDRTSSHYKTAQRDVYSGVAT